MYVKDIRQQLQKKLGSSIYKLVEKVLDREISIIDHYNSMIKFATPRMP